MKTPYCPKDCDHLSQGKPPLCHLDAKKTVELNKEDRHHILKYAHCPVWREKSEQVGDLVVGGWMSPEDLIHQAVSIGYLEGTSRTSLIEALQKAVLDIAVDLQFDLDTAEDALDGNYEY